MSGGFAGTVKADLSDALGDLTGATVRACLVAEGPASGDLSSAPAVADSAWQSVTGGGAPAVVTVLVDGKAPGHYWLAIDVERSGRHELVWAMDADHPTRRGLVVLV